MNADHFKSSRMNRRQGGVQISKSRWIFNFKDFQTLAKEQRSRSQWPDGFLILTPALRSLDIGYWIFSSPVMLCYVMLWERSTNEDILANMPNVMKIVNEVKLVKLASPVKMVMFNYLQ